MILSCCRVNSQTDVLRENGGARDTGGGRGYANVRTEKKYNFSEGGSWWGVGEMSHYLDFGSPFHQQKGKQRSDLQGEGKGGYGLIVDEGSSRNPRVSFISTFNVNASPYSGRRDGGGGEIQNKREERGGVSHGGKKNIGGKFSEKTTAEVEEGCTIAGRKKLLREKGETKSGVSLGGRKVRPKEKRGGKLKLSGRARKNLWGY